MRSSICSGGLLVVLMLLHAAWAQAPTTIGYQGVLTDGGGTAVVDGTHALSFGLYEAASGGTAVWTETQTVATVNGVFQASLGSVTELSIDFDRALWLGIGVDGGAELSPRVELTGSPYSLIARSVADGAVTVGKLADGAVTSAKIVDGTVGSLDLGAGAVTASRVADGAITSAKLADGSIRAADVATGQVVTGVNGLQDAVTLAAGSNVTITPSGNTLTIASVGGSGGGELADGAVTGAKIADGGVGRVDLANGAVSAAKLQDGAVTGAKITDGTIAADDLADGAVTGGKLADGAVSAVKLADGSVTGLKIAASAVTSVQIVDGSITAGDIGGGQVVKSVNGLQDAVTFVAGSNVTITPSGNSLSISANMGGGAGTGDIADNAITASKILDGAVTGAKLLDGTVGSGDLADGAVTGAKIAGGAVGSADLANDAVSSAKVQNGAITGVKIADGAVGTGDLAADAVTGAKIADGSVGAADLAANAVTGSKVADGTLGAADVASGQVVTGVNGLKDEVTLAAGANVTITPSGNTLTIGSSGSGALADDAVTSAKIADGTIAAGDIGGSQVVKSVNGLQDAVTFVAGSNVTITPSGNSLSISANMGGGAGTGDIADNAITASKILDGAVTGAKILDGTIASGDLAADAVTGVKIADGSIDTGDLANDAVSSAKVQNGAITGVKIADGAVGSTDLADGSVTGAKIADGTVAAADLADGAVTSAKIVDGAVGSTDLSADAVTGAKIADGAVASGDLADGSVTSAKIVDGAVGAADLSADAVTGAKIADGTVAAADLSIAAVTSAKIADGTIVTADLGTGVVTTAQVQDGSITSAKIADGTVGSADIGGGQVVKSVNGLQDALTLAAGSNVTITPSGNTLTIASSGGGSLADDAVTSAKIADGAVGSADLAANAVTGGKIADGTIAAVDVAGGQVVKSVNGLKDAVTLVAGSNVTITPSGNSLSISASTGGGVGTGDIADNAITTAKILDGAVTSAKIIDGTVVSGDLANGAVTSAKLASSAVTGAKIADGTVASGDLAADAVVTAKLADGSVTSAKIVDGTIGAGDLAADAVVTAKLQDGSVTSAKIADGTIAAGDIGGAQVVKSVNGLLDAVTLAAGTNVTITPSGNTLTFASGDLADGSVTSAKIADGGVATVDLANDAVTSAKVADGTIASADLANNAVTTTQIGDGTIATADLAADAITSAKIADGVVSSADIADGTVAVADLAADAVVSTKIADGTIASADLANDAVITAKLADGSVTSAKIADGTIAAGDIGADAIISAKIADGTIASGDLAADAVVSAKIADGTIVAGDIGAAQVVKSVSGLTDAVTLAAGTNVTITPSGNTLTFAAGGPGNTLDGAYDQGGAGAGRTITADNGAVDIAGAGGLTVNGSAGIGTTSPGGKIGVNGDVSSNEIATLVAASASTNFATDYPYLALINTDATTNNYARIDFRDTDGSVSVASLAGVFTDHTNDYGDLAFLTRNAGGFGEKMRLSSSGNLGIGIAGPRVPLDVVRTTTGSGQILQVGSLSFYKDATPTKAADIGMYPVGGAITDDLVFSLFDGASWSERMRISNNGNVGIGTTTPDVRLDLVGDANGALRITSNETDATAKVLNLIGSQYTNANGSWHIIGGQASNTANSMRIGGGYSGYDAATEVRFYTGAAVNTDTGTERMRIDASGRVGIGTSTPDDAKLEIVNTSSGNAATGLMLINEATAAGTATRLDFTPNTDTTVPLARIEANRTAVGGATDLIFLTSTNGAPVSEKMRINTSGNVGIGVASPTSMLHITDNTTPADNEWASIKAFANGNSFIWGHSNTEYDNAIGTLNGGGNPFISFFSYHGGTANTLKYSSGTIPPGRFLYSAGGQLYYDTAAAGTQDADIATWNTRLTILNDGKIGIGTTTPAEKLSIEEGHINLNHSSTPYMRIQRAGAEHGYIGSAGALFGGTQTDFGVRAESNLIFGSSSAEYMRLTNGGKFGIGETSPTKRLHVKDASVAVAAFNRTGDDGPIISIQQDGAEEGTISVAVNTVSYNAFTGSHYAWTDREIEMGTLVRLTGENRRLHDAAESEILYGVAPSTRANDPAILGAYLQLQESMQPAGADNPHLVMAVGNGVMWVVDNGEDIGIGDYLVSADLEGHAMRDPGSYETSYVVARAAEPVCWEGVDEMAGGRKRRKISVFFESFAYNHSLEKIEKLQTENRALSRSNERLEAKVAKLAAAVRRLEALIAVQKSVESEDGALVAVE